MDLSSDNEPAGIKPVKAYKSQEFLNSREARTIRVICEFEETLQRLRNHRVRETILVFGSRAALPRKKYELAVQAAQQQIEKLSAENGDPQAKEKLEQELESLRSREWMCEMYDKVEELSTRLTEWAVKSYKSTSHVGGGFLTQDQGASSDDADDDDTEEAMSASDVESVNRATDVLHGRSSNAWAHDGNKVQKRSRRNAPKQSLMICTGGGPGLMEAANKGASRVPGAKSVGMGISLPGDPKLNPYVTPELAFEYHYFFTRKYWMLYPCRALVVPPGGFSTLDTLFELLTLKQTGKIKIDVPVVLFGKQFWNDVINFQALVRFGTISQRDHDSLFFTDDVQEAFDFITTKVVQLRDKDRELFFTDRHKKE